MESEYITVPSTVIDPSYPNNSNNRFAMSLPKSLLVNKSNIKVGLKEVEYTASWNNVNDAYIDVEVRNSQDSNETETTQLKIPNGRYKTHKELMHSLKVKMKLTKLTKLGSELSVSVYDTLRFVFDPYGNRSYVAAKRKGVYIRFSTNMGMLFGMTPNAWQEIQENKSYTNVTAPDINGGISSMFIYCNLVKPRTVGTTSVRLLRSVGLGIDTTHSTVSREFQHTHYLDVEVGRYNSIEVYICKQDGKPFPFASGNVILTLHITSEE